MDRYVSKITFIYCACTSSYVTLLLAYQHYTDNIYKIGKLHNAYIIFTSLVFGEFLKLLWSSYVGSARENELLKFRKLYAKKFKIREICKIVLTFACTTALYYCIAVLFGAPILSACEETLIVSLLVSLLTIVPACINIGVDDTLNLLMGNKVNDDIFTEMFYRNIQLTLFGTWLGAVVIPLDWDRPWQEWPISCCIGAFLGHITSNLITMCKTMFKGHKIVQNKKTKPV